MFGFVNGTDKTKEQKYVRKITNFINNKYWNEIAQQ